jgi:hypothetical protein
MDQMTLGKLIVKRFSDMDSERGNWKDYWSQILKYVYPDRDNVYGERTEGQKTNSRVFDGTAIRSNRDLSNAMVSLLMNPSAKWCFFSTGDPKLDLEDAMSKWLDDCTRRMLNTLQSTNFYTSVHEAFLDDNAIGTSAFLVLEDEDDLVRFDCQPIYEWVVAENHKKIINVGYRKYQMTLRQMFDQFGESILEDPDLAREYKETPEKKYDVIQAIEPRSNLEKQYPEIAKETGLSYVSIHVLCVKQKVLKIGGFSSNPLVVSRHSRQSGELYGRSPAMEAFPDIKTANALKKIILVGGQLAIAPPLQATDNSVMRGVKLRPYGMTFRRPGSDEIKSLFTGARPDIGFDLLEKIQKDIEDFFYLNQLRTIQADRMTATEIMQRRDEQFRSFGAILVRKDVEFVKPTMERVFQIMFEAGKFPEPPPGIEMTEGRLKIVYNSMIAKSMVAAEAENFTRAMQISEPVFSLDPAVGDNIDSDTVLRSNFKNLGVDASFLRTSDSVKQIRETRAESEVANQQLATQQAQAQVQQTSAQAGKLRSETAAL